MPSETGQRRDGTTVGSGHDPQRAVARAERTGSMAAATRRGRRTVERRQHSDRSPVRSDGRTQVVPPDGRPFAGAHRGAPAFRVGPTGYPASRAPPASPPTPAHRLVRTSSARCDGRRSAVRRCAGTASSPTRPPRSCSASGLLAWTSTVPRLPRHRPGPRRAPCSTGPDGGLLLWLAVRPPRLAARPARPGRRRVLTFHLPFIGAAMVLGGPTAGAWVAFLSTIERRELESQPWYGILANHSVSWSSGPSSAA